jgi:predicted PurR-regulated permease PerM
MNPSAPQHIPLWSTRQVMTATLLVASILALFYLIYRFSQVIFIFFIAIVLGTAIRPAVKWLHRRGLPRPTGIILLYALGLSLLAAIAIAVVPLLVEQTTEFSNEIPAYYGNFRSDLIQSRSRILQEIAIQMPPEFKLTPPIPGSEGGEPGIQAEEQVTRSLPYVDIFVRSALALTAVFVLGFYWTVESERSIRSVLLWLPKGRRAPIREFINEVEDKVGRFILGQGILCLIIGVMALIVYLLIGLPYALLLAILAGIMEAVPLIGPVLGAIPALLVALSSDPTKAIWVIAATLLIQGLENYLLVPRVMKQSVGVNPLVILLALAAFTSLLGLAGALLAIPIAAIVQLFVNRFVISNGEVEIETPEGRGQLSLLRYETQDLAWDIRKQLREKENADGFSDVTMDNLEAIANRLDQILSLAEQRETGN